MFNLQRSDIAHVTTKTLSSWHSLYLSHHQPTLASGTMPQYTYSNGSLDRQTICPLIPAPSLMQAIHLTSLLVMNAHPRMQVSRGPAGCGHSLPRFLYYCSHGTGWYLRDVLLSEISPLPVPRARTYMRGRFLTRDVFPLAVDLYIVYI